MSSWFSRLRQKEKSTQRQSLSYIFWSGFGAFIGIYATAMSSHLVDIDALNNLLIIGSMGASATLLYGVPQAELSQPRNLLGGHVISAFIGVMLYQNLPLDPALVAALAVSISIVVMQLTRTLHPPGGATALIAVIGGHDIHLAGYLFVIFPVLSGAMVMLVVALMINNLSSQPDRRYPRYWF